MYLFKQLCVDLNVNPFNSEFDGKGRISVSRFSDFENEFECDCLMKLLACSFIKQNDTFCQQLFEQITNSMSKERITSQDTN